MNSDKSVVFRDCIVSNNSPRSFGLSSRYNTSCFYIVGIFVKQYIGRFADLQEIRIRKLRSKDDTLFSMITHSTSASNTHAATCDTSLVKQYVVPLL